MLNAPDPPAFRMGKAPLVQAVLQVTFPLQAQLATIETVAPLQRALRQVFPYVQKKLVHEFSVTVGANVGTGHSQASETVNFEFSNDDGWVFTVAAGGASLTVGGESYRGVSDFEDRLLTVLEALQDVVGITRCDRIGVRYLSLVSIDSAGPEWATWFRPELLGIAHPTLISNQNIEASITETRVSLPSIDSLAWASLPINGVIRNGVIPPRSLIAGAPPKEVVEKSFVLDLDVFFAGLQPFEAKALAGQYIALHGEIERVFYWAVSESGREHFELEELDTTSSEG